MSTEQVDESGSFICGEFMFGREARLYPVSILDCFFYEDCNENPDKKRYDSDVGLKK